MRHRDHRERRSHDDEERHPRRGGGPGREGRGGRKRLFDGGELRHAMLALIGEEPRHGYDIIRELGARTGGAYAPSPGVVYPALTLLEETGLVAQQASEGDKKQFVLTDAGRLHLAENAEAIAETFARLDHIRVKAAILSYGPVARAMDNLKAALRGRLSDGAEKEVVFAVADAIDLAARTIERL